MALYITNSDNIIIKSDIMRLEAKIISLLAKDIKKEFTINEIAKNLGEHYSFVHRIVNRLSKDKIITKNIIGKSWACSLNLELEKTIILIKLSEIESKEKFYEKNKTLKLILNDFTDSITQISRNITVILFGSYAKNTATEKSDIDILVISQGEIELDKITKEIYAKYGKEINPILMDSNEFKNQKDKPIIKDVIKDHYILYGVEKFVNMVFKE